MATVIRHTLQKDLFEPDDERLLMVMHVTTADRKKKAVFLCITVSPPPSKVRIHEVRYEKGEIYRKKRVWQLKELQVVDGKNPRKPIADFELTFDDVYKYVATNVTEKDLFIRQLWRLSNKHLVTQRPDFVNVSLPVDEMELNLTAELGNSSTSQSDGVSQQPDDSEEPSEFLPISAKEETDFRRLMSECQVGISRAEEFGEKLAANLAALDSANVAGIMSKEEEVKKLLEMMDLAINEATQLEEQLTNYDNLLSNVKDSVEKRKEKATTDQKQLDNRKTLASELNSLVTAIDFPESYEKLLADPNLSDLSAINKCSQAALAAYKCQTVKLSPGLEKMRCYNDQLTNLLRLCEGFAEKLVAHLSALFNRLTELSGGSTEGLQLAKRPTVFQALMPYAELVGWLKMARPDAHRILLERYVSCFKQVYDREITDFFDRLKSCVRGSFDRKSSVKKSLSSSERLTLKSTWDTRSTGSSESNENSERLAFHKVVDTLLSELEPVVLAEQKFCIRFFHLSYEVQSVVETVSTGSSDSPEKKLEKQFNDEVKRVMSRLFDRLDVELQGFVAHCDKENPYFNMHLLAKLYKHVMGAQDTSAYMAVIPGKIVVITKRKFDSFMETRIAELPEFRLAKRTRVGILPFLAQFEELAVEAESAFKTTERRNDIDRWYHQLVTAMFDAIQRISEDPNNKSPPSVILLENFHRLFAMLAHLKISCLEQVKKEAKQRYQEALRSYVVEFMGKPLDRLSGFFDSVEHAIEQGLKPEEVSYQMSYNKQELRKLIKDYPSKEVKKGLDQLYKKVEKHLCEEENLLQVVWHEMQNEFIQQYKHYESLIAQCYPNSNISLEFSIDDVLTYFSDIAQQH